VVDGPIAYQPQAEPTRELLPGTTFFEPASARINRFDNLSTTEPATFVAYYLLTANRR
jgi:hypothetical protein